MKPTLSVCIPVYNGARFIAETLDSFRSAANDLEIVVLDAGSTDGTDRVVRGYQDLFPQLRLERQKSRGGIDADLARCVAHAGGTYCWLFGGDDVACPGAVRRLGEWLERGADVYLLQHSDCTRSMYEYGVHPVLWPNEPFTAEMADRTQREHWCRRAVNTEGFFSFLSGLVVRREKWNSGSLLPEFDGTCWGHAARLFGLFDSGLEVTYVAEVLLRKRGDNDSFATSGIVRRYALAIDGYMRIARHYFGAGSVEFGHIRRALRAEFRLNQFLSAKLECVRAPDRESLAELQRLYSILYPEPKSVRDRVRARAFQWAPVSAYSGIRDAVRLVRGRPGGAGS